MYDTIEGLRLACYDWRFEDFFTFTDVASVPISNNPGLPYEKYGYIQENMLLSGVL